MHYDNVNDVMTWTHWSTCCNSNSWHYCDYVIFYWCLAVWIFSWNALSCYSQSTVCHKIVESLVPKGRVEIISQECFYRTLDDQERQLAERGMFDFDHPGMMVMMVWNIIVKFFDIKLNKASHLLDWMYFFIKNKIF